ncbi:MAG: hypothetical protein OHK0013_17620 [Sandaracinaceae bacterium]
MLVQALAAASVVDEARVVSARSIARAVESNERFDLADQLRIAADLAGSSGRPDEARDYLTRARVEAQACGRDALATQLAHELARLETTGRDR